VRHKRHDIETLQKIYRVQKTKEAKLTEEKIYKRRNFIEEEKNTKEKHF